MSTPPATSTPRRRFTRYLPAGRAWWLIAGAVATGVLLFVLVLSGKRDEFEFYRAGGEPGQVEGQAFDPLPAPLPAGQDAASGMDQRPAAGAAPRIDQHAASPPPPPGSPAQAGADGDRGADVAAAVDAVPRLLSAPPPDYPAAALRAGVSGQVVLQIEVRADGRPGDVEIVSSSRNRALDREAVRAVRRWRFQPAMRDGVAVPATVQQTISFDAPR